MGKSISPVVAILVIVIVVVVAAVAIWKGAQNTVHLPAKPPSGPITLPESQQGRRMPGGAVSGPMTNPAGR